VAAGATNGLAIGFPLRDTRIGAQPGDLAGSKQQGAQGDQKAGVHGKEKQMRAYRQLRAGSEAAQKAEKGPGWEPFSDDHRKVVVSVVAAPADAQQHQQALEHVVDAQVQRQVALM
jgi:hypothetical protein